MRDYLEALFIALIISWLITPWYRRAAEKLGWWMSPMLGGSIESLFRPAAA